MKKIIKILLFSRIWIYTLVVGTMFIICGAIGTIEGNVNNILIQNPLIAVHTAMEGFWLHYML